ncbi:histidine phosphatase [Streptomyces viridochromogenes]|uniref:Histidine phosphatase n=1 Tax=Streptomyces viridochromogenes TaxID=1938 RepID=A0A0J7ZNV8_STRVR|nr:histidine phosphatase family protein [Streptomyces viridochromogenes]KMS76818.1 histidine phosphatase [Streptomyces viridochromogenes]KOG21949.1 histidine phosphatase [Streptomyces viridochromogenes]KOG29888.1 histidine phosphatase [Streptomyces viridochromogenes]
MRLLLVRHGQTPANVDYLLDTSVPGAGLTALGEQQAAALPAALADEDIEAVYASTLVRTQLTAAPLAAARGLDVLVRDGIREVFAGDLEMARGDTEQGGLYMRTVFAWAAGDTGLRMPGGESGVEVLARYDSVVAEAAASGAGTVAMVSHGAAIRMWTAARAVNVDVPFAAAHPLDNTGVVILEGAPADGWKALTWAGAVVAPVGEGGPTGRAVDAD